MLNPIFKENVQGRKHPGSLTFAEPELLSYRTRKSVVQKEKNGYKNHSDSHNYHDENQDDINDTQQQNNAHPKTNPIDCDGVRLTKAQCHMVPVSIHLWAFFKWNLSVTTTSKIKCIIFDLFSNVF